MSIKKNNTKLKARKKLKQFKSLSTASEIDKRVNSAYLKTFIKGDG